MADPNSSGDGQGPADMASSGTTVSVAASQAAAQVGSEGRPPALTATATAVALTEATATAPTAAATATAPTSTAPTSTDTIVTATATKDRKKYLLSLVPELSLDEIWMLQQRLAGLDLRTDIFSRLPPELQILIADDLGPSDLGFCLQVSSRWRDALLHESMLKKQARRCFPSLLEYIDAVYKREAAAGGAGTAGTDSPDTLVAKIFSDTAKQYAVRARGRFSFVFRHCKDPPARLAEEQAEAQAAAPEKKEAAKTAEAATAATTTAATAAKRATADTDRPTRKPLTWLNTERPRPCQQRHSIAPLYPQPDLLASEEQDMLLSDSDEDDLDTYMSPDYAYGRLAWQYISNTYTSFIVDDLRTGKRDVFNVMNSTVRGQTHLLCAFGDRLLITSAGTSIMAWDFISGETYTKTLPAQMDMVATLGNTVYILSQGTIFVWKTGGPVLEADMTGLAARFRQPDRDGRLPSYFVPDPVDQNVFFLGNYEVNGGANGLAGELCVHLHRFKDLKYSETFTHSLPFSNFAFPSRIIGTNARRDARGLFSVATWRTDKGTPGWKQTSSHAVLDRIGSLSFDIYTHQFAVSYFPLPPQSPAIRPDHFHTINTHIWNSQLITLVDRYRDAVQAKIRVAKPLLLAFEDENGQEARCVADVPFSALPLYVSSRLPRQAYHSKADALDVSARPRHATHALDNPSIIKPELCTCTQFHKIHAGTAAAWQQSDDDWATNGCILRFGLDVVTLRKGREDRPTHIRQYSLEGDDDFLVMHYDNEYTVWCFNDTIEPTGWEAYSE